MIIFIYFELTCLINYSHFKTYLFTFPKILIETTSEGGHVKSISPLFIIMQSVIQTFFLILFIIIILTAQVLVIVDKNGF